MGICRILVASMWWTSLAAAALPDPPVEDPFGLGPRLALIDHLREQMGQQPRPDLDYEALKAMYWEVRAAQEKAEAEQSLPTFTAQSPFDADALMRDEQRRIRRVLEQDFAVLAPADADTETLRRLLREARSERKEAALEAAEREVQREKGHATAPSGTVRPVLEFGAATGPEGAWRRKLADYWQDLEALPLQWEARWQGEFLAVEGGGSYRIADDSGQIDITREKPMDRDGISAAWWRKGNQWRPLTWHPLEGGWDVSNSTYLLLQAQEAPYNRLLFAMLDRPEADANAVSAFRAAHHAANLALAPAMMSMANPAVDPLPQLPAHDALRTAALAIETTLKLPGFADMVMAQQLFNIRSLAFQQHNAQLQKTGENQGAWQPSATDLERWQELAQAAQAALQARFDAVRLVLSSLR